MPAVNMPQGFARGLRGICHAHSLTTSSSSSASFQVSWLRDTFPIPMLLALNNLTNIADERFFAFHVPGTERFSLRLARTRVGDSGFYECQVATREGEAPLFRLIYLDVVSEFTLLSCRERLVRRPVTFCRRRMLRPAKLAQFPLQYPLSVFLGPSCQQNWPKLRRIFRYDRLQTGPLPLFLIVTQERGNFKTMALLAKCIRIYSRTYLDCMCNMFVDLCA